MSDKPPFDPQKSAFWLVCAVLAYQGFIVLFGIASCFVDFVHNYDAIINTARIKCDPDNRLLDLLSTGLAAALGYAAGMAKGDK